MTQEQDTASMTLWQKIAAISKEVGHIEKTGKNAHFNYNFIEHSTVVATLRPILDQYGVTIDLEALDATFTPGDRSTRVLLHMRYTVTNADKPEETFNRLWVSEAMDQQDKGINKALTAAEKNVFMKLFHISDVDPDSDEGNQPQEKAKPRQQAPIPAARPVTQPTPKLVPLAAIPPSKEVEKITDSAIKQILSLAGKKSLDEIDLAKMTVELYGKPLPDLELNEGRHFYSVLQSK
jgi:hypothetical protein